MDWVSTGTGFITGFGIVSIIVLVMWRRGKKARLFDERYEKVHVKARTVSWIVFVGMSYIMALMALIIEGWKLAAILLASLYGAAMLTYFLAVFIYNRKL
ncbi:DUF3796 domain-containing protein [Sporosarcina aquimarina]|uniref:DUF3796 domain-containing protein n=1 Tax=Sporosarcina aquimarina TaxID=114975 RepID=A0ABU4G255_9BACL|nr:DUF3796 domain-containing protein [Sporosarcina aquimarina]MDW0111051.1 DUF3796 domain-containing protein [Sporosarcina aquimarina]